MQDPPVLVKSGEIHAKMCVAFKCLYILSAWHQVVATSLRLKFGNTHFYWEMHSHCKRFTQKWLVINIYSLASDHE